MRRRLLAFIASAVLLPAIGAGSAAADGPSVQGVGQTAGSQQSASSSANSTQVQPSNTNISVRIGSGGDGGAVNQSNSSTALSAAGNSNDTTQQAGQSAGGAGVQDANQAATNDQSADSSANSTQIKPSNTNISVRIGSPGDDGSVTQTNSSKAASVAGNKNSTTQAAGQSGGGSGGTQSVDQKAGNEQAAQSDATSKQVKPSNTNIAVRIGSKGNDGSVTQTNSSDAKSAAGNKNETTQQSEQGSGGAPAPLRSTCGGTCGSNDGPAVQDADQKAYNDQSADSSATSTQVHPSNVNIPVRIDSPGTDGDVTQANSSDAKSAAGNKNATTQSAEQSAGGSGADPVQHIGQKAGSGQDATSGATSDQYGASNANDPVRIGSEGGGGSVDQSNSSDAKSAAGNLNGTSQDARQYAGGGGAPAVQDVDQKAFNRQSADSSADSTQCCASNTNSPVRIKSEGDDGDVTQSNSSSAKSVAGNKNDTTQYAQQDAGAPVELVPVKDGCDTCGHGGGDPVVQQIDQKAKNGQEADSTADSTQTAASNSNDPVRIKSSGGGGSVDQSNDSTAVSAAGNKNSTDQSADQSAGGGSGGPTVQAIGQWADNWQGAESHATSEQDGASNTNSPVRIKSRGDDGDVTQSNSSTALSAAGNKNDTTQNASQDAGGTPALTRSVDGCGSCGGGDGAATVQGIGQWASSGQKADSSADSTQDGACNTNSPVRIKSKGDDGDVSQSNSSFAGSAAGNKNDTDQSADQSAGSGGVDVQAIGQWADNGQHASSDATSDQYDPSNSNAPVRLHSWGGGGSVEQSNASKALSAAGNRNSTCQRASQGSGGVPRCAKKERKPVLLKQED
jgi:trimeric autotransporter adhesin